MMETAMSDLGAMESDETVVTKVTAGSVDETVARLSELITARSLTLFAIIDHSGEARRAGLELRDTKVVIFGSPEAGTPVVQSAPLAALDLPLKVLVWDDGGETKVSYTAPGVLAERHHLSDELAQRLSAIGPITNALVAS
jgi:uncharacterized protein (DUF302 family)